jgi:hypothetical protein
LHETRSGVAQDDFSMETGMIGVRMTDENFLRAGPWLMRIKP